MIFTLAGIEVFSQIKGVRRDVGLGVKSLEAMNFDKIQSKTRSRRSQVTTFEARIFEFQKRSGFLKGERGRQAVAYMEEVLIVELGFFQLFCYV